MTHDIEVIIWQFDRIVEGFLPKVHDALAVHGVNSEYYAIQWLRGQNSLKIFPYFSTLAVTSVTCHFLFVKSPAFCANFEVSVLVCQRPPSARGAAYLGQCLGGVGALGRP